MIKNDHSLLVRYLLLFLSTLLLCIPPSSAAATAKTLQKDIAYYHKVAAEKRLSPNDRYYILLRINDKYDGTNVDLAPLHAEMRKLNATAPKPARPPAARPKKKRLPAAARAPAAAVIAESTGTIPASVNPQSSSSNAGDPAPAVQDATERSSPSSESYIVEIGDILNISVFPTEELSRESVVQTDGSIIFPLIGAAKAKGMTTKELERSLEKQLGKYVTSPRVLVTVKQFNRRQVLITGEVRSVGAFAYRDKIRLMEFISSAGGFTDAANRKEIRIYRGPPANRQKLSVNVEEIIKSGDFSKDFALEPGDIIEVPKGQARISILGDVKNPGYYDFRAKMRLTDLISLAGGYTDNASITGITVIHLDPDQTRRTEKVNLKKILSGKQADKEIQSGDTVYIPRKTLAASNVFVNNILPWLTLISLVIIIRGGT